MNKKVLQRIGIILLYGILAGIGVNCFLTPAKVYSGGNRVIYAFIINRK